MRRRGAMGIALMGLVSAGLVALGVRLLRLSRRTQARPELWLALAFGFAGGFAWLVPLAARDGLGHETARAVAFTAQGGLTVAIAFLALFTGSVFRPAPPARWIAPLLVAMNLAATASLVASGTPLPVGRVAFFVLLSRCAVLLWLFAESALYARRMRRRIRLGIGDPLVANRFTLWAIWTGALACIPLFVLALRMLGLLVEVAPGAPIPPAVRAIIAVLGMGGAAALVACWLAFFPPAFYRGWITRTATAR